MDENKKHIKNLGQKLPLHSPDPGLWQHLSAKLDAIDAEAAYQEKLQGLPVHSPDEGTWSIIAGRLNRIAYYKTGLRIALSAAAGLLLFITVSRISDQYQNKTIDIQQLSEQEQPIRPAGATKLANPGELKKTGIPETTTESGRTSAFKNESLAQATKGKEKSISKSVNTLTGNNIVLNPTALVQDQTGVEPGTLLTNPENATASNTEVVSVQNENNANPAAQPASSQDETAVVTELPKSDTNTRSVLFQKEPIAIINSPPSKYYSLPEPKPGSNKNNFALAMGYFPENMDNGTSTSLFHNVDLTASYNKEKVRFNTSFGMAYNEEQLQFEMNYDINSFVTAVGPGGKIDTLSRETAIMESEYLGTEKHKYVTYNLGFGRRLFSAGKFSTWINAGAGFGIKLNEPDLISSTASSVKNQYNARNVSISSTGPVYNDVNVNFVTAIDFNYNIISKLSISFAPVSRWYFKPVLSKNNQATDELTLGFRTGLKFDF